MKVSEIAWAAGFIDGEGCFSLAYRNVKGRNPHFRLSVTQSDRRPLDKLAAIAGHGNVHGPYKYASRSLSKKSTYTWTLTGPWALSFYKSLKPYLCEPKKEQVARVLLEIQEIKATK